MPYNHFISFSLGPVRNLLKDPFLFGPLIKNRPIVIIIRCRGNAVPIFKGKAFLVNEGIFVTGIAVAAEAEISQTVDDAPPFIGLRSLHNVGMGTQNQMSAVVDGKMGKIALVLVGIGLKLRSPVEIADDETGAPSLHFFQFRNELCLRAAP